MSSLLAEERFHAWTGQHFLLLAITAVGVVAVVWWGRTHRDTPRELVARRGFALVILAVAVGAQVYSLTSGVRHVQTSLPLQLSDLADYTAAFALWTRGPRTSAFTYYVGLTLTLMAVLTPSLGQAFPDPRWFGFWVRHILVVWAAVYLVWGLGIRPTWRLYRTTVVAALVWAVVAYTFNVAAGTNYGYLVDKPSSASLLDLLGPWPWYVLGAMALLLGGWAVVLTLPWELARARAAAGPDTGRVRA
ncbi:MAG: TIGR02206 family membrane protein [Nocardioidaceae bacterium]|nr:TIGR02206 family membrane protein [Nocardioidaceae bacterium]